MGTTSGRALSGDEARKAAKPKRAYVAPKLRLLGSVADLTAGVGGSQPDGSIGVPHG
jgi:hypothetical protein